MTDLRSSQPVTAALAALGGMFVLGFTDNLVRIVAAEAGLWQFHAFRSAMVLAALLAYAAIGGGGLRARRPAAVAGRSLAMGLSMAAYFASLGVLPIGIAVAGFFTAPIFVLILSALVLGHRVGVWRWSAAAAGFAGVLMVLQPGTGATGLVLALPVAAGLLYGVTAVLTRATCEGETTLVLTVGAFVAMISLGLIGLAVLALVPGLAGDSFLSRPFAAPGPGYLGLMMVLALGALAGNWLLIRAYQLGEASHVAIFEYGLMVFAGVWAYLLWGETVDLLALAGMALIVLSGAVIAIRSR
jgi:drug/metabolite transporter (DMT)-like permease